MGSGVFLRISQIVLFRLFRAHNGHLLFPLLGFIVCYKHPLVTFCVACLLEICPKALTMFVRLWTTIFHLRRIFQTHLTTMAELVSQPSFEKMKWPPDYMWPNVGSVETNPSNLTILLTFLHLIAIMIWRNWQWS